MNTVAHETTNQTTLPGIADAAAEAALDGESEQRQARIKAAVQAQAEAIERLCGAAEASIAEYKGTKRPTWAPSLVLGDELADVLREIGMLAADDKPVARLWARFTSPSRGPIRCEGVELCAGSKHGREFFYVQRTDSGWATGPRWQVPSRYEARWWARYPMYVRATELGGKRVLEFLGSADEQMLEGARLTITCSICGRGLTDPHSIEVGVGPECRSRHKRVLGAAERQSAERPAPARAPSPEPSEPRWRVRMEFLDTEDDVHLDAETSKAVFALYDHAKQDGPVSSNPSLGALLARIFPTLDIARARYSYHQAGDWTKGITVDFLIEGHWDRESVVDSFRFDPWETELRDAHRVTTKRASKADGAT